MNINIILFVIISVIILYIFLVYKIEKMTDNEPLTENKIKELIRQVYQADVEAIRNLSNIATELQKNGLTIPGNLTVTGKIVAKGGIDGDLNVSGNLNTDGKLLAKGGINGDLNVSGNLNTAGKLSVKSGIDMLGNLGINGSINLVDGNTTLSKGSNNSLKVKTANGYVELGPQNNDWCHIYTDRPKFALNKIITDVSVNPYNDYVRTNLPFRLDQKNTWNNGAGDGPVTISDAFVLKGFRGGGANYTKPNWTNFTILQ